MGMYVCNNCFEKHGLTPDFGLPHTNDCECCKTPDQWVNFTWDLTRFGASVADQLKQLSARSPIPALPAARGAVQGEDHE